MMPQNKIHCTHNQKALYNYSMGYMELKRVNQELQYEMKALQESSEQANSEHLNIISRLTQEIIEHKVNSKTPWYFCY